jgi:ATP/ADP translocase
MGNLKQSLFKDSSSFSLFFFMFSISSLLNVAYAILRSLRAALVVADLGGGASVIPWFELSGTMPGALLMTLGITWLVNRFSMQKVFLLTLALFLTFFVIFSFGIYPILPRDGNLVWLSKLGSMSFFVMAELWKVALLTLLFWGFINQHIPLEKAKKFYAPLMLGSSIGTIAAGPIISLCTSDFVSLQSWERSLNIMILVIVVIGCITGFLFLKLWNHLNQETSSSNNPIAQQKPPSVWESFKICFKSRY